MTDTLHRRRVLIGGAGALALAGVPARAQSGDPFAECALAAPAIEGPYHIETQIERSDVRDGRPGVDLALRIQIVEAGTCAPIPAARVEIWSCDALGRYSGYDFADPDTFPSDARSPQSHSGQDRFLRGVQMSDRAGNLAFTTVFPGWHTPRTPHVGFKVHLRERELVTGQMYFPADVIADVHALPPYNQRPQSPFTNDNDFILQETGGALGCWPAMTWNGNGLAGWLRLGVRTGET